MIESDFPTLNQCRKFLQKQMKLFPPSPDVKNQLPDHEPIEKEKKEVFICPVCRKSFSIKADLDLHTEKDRGQINTAREGTRYC
jgi:hypothetical protein